MSEIDKSCGCVVDEMSTEEAREFCQTTKQIVGNTTLPVSEQLASKAIVFMLVGIQSRWKQVVAYHHTGSSIGGKHLKDMIVALIRRAEGIGLKVYFCTSDSGSENQKFWKDLGVNFTKGNVFNDLSVPHPANDSRRMEIVPDPVHLFKNAVHGWINNVFLTVPQWYVEEKHLKSNIVHREHLRMLVNYEKNNQLHMSYSLSESDVCFENNVSSVDKMKVCNATKYCNLTVSAALRVYAAETGNKDVITTACYIEDLSHWFSDINNRVQEHALDTSDDTYQEKINNLKKITHLVYDLKVGESGKWKPWKSGIVMSTNAILRIVERLSELGATKILTSRFSQDCLESLFSVARSKQRRPTSLEFRRNLKNITLSQYMSVIPNASYITDEQQHLVGMIELLSQRRKDGSFKEHACHESNSVNNDEEIIEVDYDYLLVEARDVLDRAEQNTLYHIAGYVFGRISNQPSSCKTCCLQFASTAAGIQGFGPTKFSIVRAETSAAKFHFITEDLFNFFMVMELLYRNYRAHNTSNTINLQGKLIEELSILPGTIFHCQSFKTKIINRFVLFRLKSGETKKLRKKKFDSRSMLY